ncbi:MAG: hypothetical protein ACRDVM_01575 [Acidimicrobiia bacterium]
MAYSKNVSADCGPGGYYTIDNAANNQKHEHDGSSVSWQYSGTLTKKKNWGWHTTLTQGTISSTNTLESAHAQCLG